MRRIDTTLSLTPVAHADAPPRAGGWAQHRLVPLFVVSQAILLVGLAPAYGWYGLTFDWSTSGPMFAAQAGFGGAWLYFRRYREHAVKRYTLDVILATLLLVTLTAIAAPAQYLAVAIRRPLVDAQLAAADAAMGFNVATLAIWTARHAVISLILTLSYVSLLPQMFLPPIFLALRYRNRDDLWEYVFHYHFCLIVCVAALAVFPAACPIQFYGVTPTIEQSRVVAHITALRAGTFHVISFMDMDGLVSVPSFHAAAGLMVTWAFRRHRALFLPLAVLNTLMVAATFVSGVHYVIDVIAAFVLFGISLGAYRALVKRPQQAADGSD